MSRQSNDDYDHAGALRNGYDYDLQLWVIDYIIPDCGHTDDCRASRGGHCCNAHKFAGRDWREVMVQL